MWSRDVEPGSVSFGRLTDMSHGPYIKEEGTGQSHIMRSNHPPFCVLLLYNMRHMKIKRQI